MKLIDVEIGKSIRNVSGKEFRVVGIDQVGPPRKKGPLVILHTGQVLNLTELKEFH